MRVRRSMCIYRSYEESEGENSESPSPSPIGRGAEFSNHSGNTNN